MVANGTARGRDPSLFDRRSMTEWAHHVRVPVFLSGALQDEQTGPQWPALIDAFPRSTPVFANMVNGDHIDSADPQTISRWLEFLDIYVADKVPTQPSSIAALVLDKFAASAASVAAQSSLPPLRFTTAPTVAAAKADFSRDTPRVRVLFDNGAGQTGPGTIGATYAASFSSWPPAGSTTTLYFGSGGSLLHQRPASGKSTFTLDPTVRPRTSLPANGNAWLANPGWDWTPVPAPDGIGYQTAPFTTSTTVVGPATLDLWVKASAPVEDFQATITEVRPQAGQEEYVTSGFLRSTNQVDASGSTALFTAPTYLPAGRPTPLVGPLRTRQGPDRSDCAHLQTRNGPAGGHLGAWWGPTCMGFRHAGQGSKDHGRSRRSRGLGVDRGRRPRCRRDADVARVRCITR